MQSYLKKLSNNASQLSSNVSSHLPNSTLFNNQQITHIDAQTNIQTDRFQQQPFGGFSTVSPPGTLQPGTQLLIGRHRVIIERYLSEGGFAHVYLVRLAEPVNNEYQAVLKRIAVSDKSGFNTVLNEVNFMKMLCNHKNIVYFIDSHTGTLGNGGYEIFILMEYCRGGPVIDLMNRRLQHRLTEVEILKIFQDICEAVAHMHYSKPPILHRDLKVENVLRDHNNTFKLCDFGSCTVNMIKPDTPRTWHELQLLEEDLQKHTTLQYRAPEMVDVYQKRPIDEKSDIWALGVLLYKLCYYTTPFEDQGQLAILSARYSIPQYPVFSQSLIGLIESMLKEDSSLRPNIYQITNRVCALRGVTCPIVNIYPEQPNISQRSMLSPTAVVVTTNSTQDDYQQSYMGTSPSYPILNSAMSNITPMRRGRPVRQGQNSVVNSSNLVSRTALDKAFSNTFDAFDPFNDMQ
ncbi:7802_t:CDS:2 [Paraglomus occultum]|uniref:non-specific serine/threonine protein kinase n=1 Tax=Paraglomus occultum TaxID=144539 RepID=A0A9N9BM32_9GLOM|nr:7802_t:CDS:2 [Paraglomus occultum]